MLWLSGLFTGAILLGLFAGCIPGEERMDQREADSVRRADSIATQFHLETLVVNCSNENDLIERYGAESVKYDTMWGAEGFFSMGTILKTEPESHIEITWQNEKLRAGIVSVTLVSDQDWYSDSVASGKWKTQQGVQLGMSVQELQNLNGRPFTFSGFGWDYAGVVTDWQQGQMENQGVAVQLSEGPYSGKLTNEESAQLMGDVSVQSDHPLVKEFNPRVWSISVAK